MWSCCSKRVDAHELKRLESGSSSPDDTVCLISQTVRRRTPPLVFVAFLFPALAGFLFGFDIGAMSGAVHHLSASPGAERLRNSPFFTGLLTSSSLGGAVLGTIACSYVGGFLGRRREIILGGGLYIVGTLVSTLTPDGADLLAWVILGRATYGVGIAFSMHAAPVYISEMAPAAVRGLLVALKEAFIVLGILCGFLASALADTGDVASPNAWRHIWSPPLAVSCVVIVGMLCMPPSPRWLVLRAMGTERGAVREAALLDATLALQRFRNRWDGSDVSAEAAEEVHSIMVSLEGESCE